MILSIAFSLIAAAALGAGEVGTSSTCLPYARTVSWPLSACAQADLRDATTTAPACADQQGSLAEDLRRGGYVIVFRHAITDRSKGDDNNLVISDRSTQRNLSADGEEQARRIGRTLSALRIPIGDVVSSPLFRARETAELAFGRAQLDEALRGQRGDSALNALFATPPAQGTNRVLVTHNFLLIRVFKIGSSELAEGDAIVLRPMGEGRYERVAQVKAADWEGMGKGEER